jgi:hypothetical protein
MMDGRVESQATGSGSPYESLLSGTNTHDPASFSDKCSASRSILMMDEPEMWHISTK